MKFGYARVSTDDQSLDLQREALQAAGCDRIFEDHGISGADFSRPGLSEVLKTLSPGDTLIVWKLDRLGRSLLDLVETIDALAARKIEFYSLTESIDTRSPGGRLIFHIMAALAEFERSLIGERTRAGMKAARAKGHHLGRPPALSESQRLEAVLAIRSMGETVNSVAEKYNVHPRTIRRLLGKAPGGAHYPTTIHPLG
ncbi:recombinase family protein [Mesorhizobium sp. RMAD-H1]|uniref:recombinase family protein n=1 Tax=Mesorhizobium sp. RMAD-H1 TaxID=2587065 RepID=UPI0016090B12|nr:recombinase family protein [Mesorhizobium sp. RMAD-H1]MBB2969804.1 DNA invertase Pin-like site-specific DNA recombinase [Mesorhizobium sp. RMAD-H1]